MEVEFAPGKSPAFNAGWESFFIGRDISDNPNADGTDYHKDWADGFTAAKANNELAHLRALELRLANEKARLNMAIDQRPSEVPYRQSVVDGVEKEIQGEIAFLASKGITVVSDEVNTLNDDELLENLLR